MSRSTTRPDAQDIAAQLAGLSLSAAEADALIADFTAVWNDLVAVARLAGCEMVSERERARRRAQAYVNTLRKKKINHVYKTHHSR